ncbi:MAG TPA: patatin-like phospholipase family protein [Coriobacteriia bacterium]
MKLNWLKRAPQAPPEPVPRRLGLALGGGAVRGAAHVGVLAVLEREGISPDVVAGVSTGAIVGAGIAAGVPAAEMMEAFRKSSWLQIAIPAWLSRLSMLDSSPLGALIEKVTSVSDFSDLRLPFAAVACDLLTGRRVVITSGSLREAIVASSAIPGLFQPVRRGGQLLVDGQLIENVPAQEALDLGADYVLGVDIMPPPVNSAEPAELRDVILMSWDIVQRRRQRDGAQPDLMVTPAVGSLSLSDFSRVGDAYDAGVAAMEAALPRLRADLGLAGHIPGVQP